MSRVRAQTLCTRIIGIPTRIAHRARKLILHLPTKCPWATDFARLRQAVLSPPRTSIVLTNPLLLVQKRYSVAPV